MTADRSRSVSSIGRWLDCESGNQGSKSFALYLYFSMYRINHFLAKVKATSIGKLLDSLSRNSALIQCGLLSWSGVKTANTTFGNTKIDLDSSHTSAMLKIYIDSSHASAMPQIDLDSSHAAEMPLGIRHLCITMLEGRKTP
jgi:hypothetical protein